MKKLGRRAVAKSKPVEYLAGHRALYTKQGETLAGRIKTVQDGVIFFRVDPEKWQIQKGEKGDLIKIKANETHHLTHQKCVCGEIATKRDVLCDACREKKNPVVENKGFNQFGVKWDPDHVNFSFKPYGEDIKFHGWIRVSRNERSNEKVFMVDMFASRKGLDVTAESIGYTTDPRENLKSLNADICAAANKWFFMKLNGNAESFDDLMKQAKHPTIYVKNIGTLDRIITKLNEYRNTAIRAGGERHVELSGDTNHPSLLITINVTPQAIALKGKIPTLRTGAIYDVVRQGKNAPKGKVLDVKASPENIKALIEQLEIVKANGDKKSAREIRAALREMGHKGGARAFTRDQAIQGAQAAH